MARYTSYLLAILALVINKSISVAVHSEKNQLEPLKPSPIDGRQPLPDERNPEKFASLTEDVTVENTHNKRNNIEKSEKLIDEENSSKRTRTPGTHGRLTERDKFNCCGTRFESSGPLSATTRSPDSNRYGDRYGGRPDDRYNWHSSSGRPGGISSNNYGSSNTGSNNNNNNDRFGTRPSPYYGAPDNDYSRPGVGNTRPTGVRPGYGYGYGQYGDSGAYGSQGFEVSHRPGSIHFAGGKRPQNYGGHGIVGEQEEVPAEGVPSPSNIQTQKAVALKALAGVALIGAAAALAANPALGVGAVLAGRKRRSADGPPEFNLLHFPENFVRDHVPKIYEDEKVAKKFWDSKKCVARLACEIQKEYVSAVRNNPALQRDVQQQLVELINSDILDAEYVRESMAMLTKIARNAEPKDGRCNIFICNLFIS